MNQFIKKSFFVNRQIFLSQPHKFDFQCENFSVDLFESTLT